MQGVTPATLPRTDPLIRLGESLTLHVLAFLPLRDLLLVPRLSRAYASLYDAHSSGIFRPACRRFDIDSEQFQELQLVEMNDVTSSNTSGQHDHLDSDGPQHDVEPSRVDWKAALRDHVVWDRNWKAGECVDRWINPSKRDVWRFKIDSEENCCIMTSRRGRVEVVDADGSTPLFAIEGLRPYAHLEFANGFAVFDNGLEPLQLEVWRNRHALARSLHPKPFGRTLSDHRPMMVEELLLPEDGSAADFATRWVTAEAPLTRGNLSFYRHISPPHPCRAFRARVDYKGTPDERSVICMAGDHGVYIYDLEEGSLVQHIRTNEAHDFCFNMTYVELDDQNVFLCTAAFFFAFSRQSHKLLLTLPPSRFDDSGEASVGISLRFDPGAHGMENGSSPVNGNHSAAASMANTVADDEEQIKPTRVRQCRPHAVRTGRAEPRHVMDPGDGQHHPFVRTAFGFEACHYAHGDLVYAGNGNRTFVTRRYESILKIAENDKRRDAWIDHTIALEIEDTESARFSNIATDRTHVVLASTDRALFFDTSTLPNMCSTTSACDCQSESGDVEVPIPELASSQPAGVNEAHHDAYVPPSASQPTANSSSHISADLAVLPTELPPGPVLHIIDSLERRGLSGMSCVQADKDNIYLTYDISHEGQTPRDPLMAILAAGRRRQDVIRCWNFAPAS